MMPLMIRVGQSYRKKPPEGSYDAIVIGSGIGGLTAAALLAKHGGKRVLVLERHYMPGGFTHVFRRRGYEWDVGVHYLGGVGSPRAGVWRLFNHVSDGSIEWEPMGQVYDRIILGDRSFDYVAGECVKGISAASSRHGVPTGFGILTVDTIEQAIERAGTKAGNKGEEATLAVIEMVNTLRHVE